MALRGRPRSHHLRFAVDRFDAFVRYILVGSIRVADDEIETTLSTVNVTQMTRSMINVIVGKTAFPTPVFFVKPTIRHQNYMSALLRQIADETAVDRGEDWDQSENAAEPSAREWLG